MKQQEATRVGIGDYNFYITPFAAMTAANMTGDLAGLATPLLVSLAPILGKAINQENGSVLDTDISGETSTIGAAFSTITGDKLERLLKKLLIDYRNISYEGIDDEKPHILDKDAVNEVFCGEVQDMFVLAYHVIKLNFSGFFRKLSSQFGSLGTLAKKLTETESENTGASTKKGSRVSN